jgi:hypothetical protein
MLETGLRMLTYAVLGVVPGAVVALVVGYVLIRRERRRDCRSLFERIRSKLFPPVVWYIGSEDTQRGIQEAFTWVNKQNYRVKRDLVITLGPGACGGFGVRDMPASIRSLEVKGTLGNRVGGKEN